MRNFVSGGLEMFENWVRRLVNARKWGFGAKKYQKICFEGLETSESFVRGLEMSESFVRRLGNARKWGSGVWKCQKIGFEGL